MNELQNKAEGKFRIYHADEVDIDGRILVVRKEHNDIDGTLLVAPSNRMAFAIEVLEVPRIKEGLSPIKDAFVRQTSPTFNYGESYELLVGYRQAEGGLFRSLLQFDISEIQSKQGIVIEKAVLKLYHTRGIDKSFIIDIYNLEDHWVETGVTWFNQPKPGEKITSFEIDKEPGYKEVDITDHFMKWYDQKILNRGIILIANDETQDTFTSFRSRESAFTPLLEVTYYDPHVYSVGRSFIESRIFVYRTGYEDILGTITINQYEDESDILAAIYINDPKAINARITVSRKWIYAKTTIRRSDEDGINGRITVRATNNADREAGIAISRPETFGTIIVRQADWEDIVGNVAVRRFEDDDIKASIGVSHPVIKGLITVRAENEDDIGSLIVVRREDDNDIGGTITVSRSFTFGRIQLKHYDEIGGRIVVYYSGKDSIGATIKLRHYEQIDGKIIVRRYSSLPARIQSNSPQIKARTTVRRSSSIDEGILPAKIIVRQWGEIGATIQLRHSSKIEGSIYIRSRGANDILAQITIEGGRRVIAKPYGYII